MPSPPSANALFFAESGEHLALLNHIESVSESRKSNQALSASCRGHLRTIADLYGLTPGELLDASNHTWRISRPRQHLMSLLRADLNARGLPLRSYPKIAAILGMQDHTSIIWGVRAHARRVAEGKVPCPS